MGHKRQGPVRCGPGPDVVNDLVLVSLLALLRCRFTGASCLSLGFFPGDVTLG